MPSWLGSRPVLTKSAGDGRLCRRGVGFLYMVNDSHSAGWLDRIHPAGVSEIFTVQQGAMRTYRLKNNSFNRQLWGLGVGILYTSAKLAAERPIANA